MAQDLRELFRKEKEQKIYQLKEGHESRFLDRLEEELPKREKRSSYLWMRIAASIGFLFAVWMYFISKDNTIEEPKKEIVATPKILPKDGISLGDLSPDLQKVENYYVANINLELARIDISKDNKALVDSFLEQLAALDNEYAVLNTELNEVGPNDQIINALIQNLQLRLQLLQKLKNKLNQIKSSENEQQTNML